MENPGLERFRLKLREYRLLVNRNQSDLAAYLNLDYNELSNRLNANKKVRLSHDNIRAIVRALAEWGAISTQAQAEELLDLMLCPHFDTVDLQAKPLSRLVTTTGHSDIGIQNNGSGETPGIEPEIESPLLHSTNPYKLHTNTIAPEPTNNLPKQLSSFTGRQKEIAHLKKVLIEDKANLVSLVGAGGCGKTRLALQVASRLLDNYQAGVWFVELAPLSDPALIPQTIAAVLGLLEQPGRPVLTTLSNYLHSRKLLLVLDNCEHLVKECAVVVDTLIQASLELQILTTSRESLGITGEISYLVPSLSLPPSGEIVHAESVVNFEALQLFVERAKTANPDFNLEPDEIAALTQICRRLDGIPLALELAAARTRVLSLEQVQTRLADRFHLLTEGSRTALPRQQTLRALVDWSYTLLSEQDKKLLNRVSIFAGSWDLAEAEQVCQDNGLEEASILDGLTSLVNKSLIVATRHGREIRYHLLETIRQYGLEQLQASGEVEAVRARHFAYYASLSLEWANNFRGHEQYEQLEALKFIDKEIDNIRAAIDFGLKSGQADAVFQLTSIEYWDVRGYYNEGRRYLDQALTLPGSNEVKRGITLIVAGFLALRQGDLQITQNYFEESLAIAVKHNDKELLAFGKSVIGLIYRARGDYAQGRRVLEEGLALAEGLGDFIKMVARANLGFIIMELGEYQQAGRLYEEAVDLGRKSGNIWSVAIGLTGQADIALILEDYGAASRYAQEALAISEEIKYPMGKITALTQLSVVMYNENRFKEARQALEESLDSTLKAGLGISYYRLSVVANLLSKVWLIYKTAGLPEKIAVLCGANSASVAQSVVVLGSKQYQGYYDNAREAARASLSEAAFELHFSRGQKLSEAELLAYTWQALSEIQ